MLQTLIAINIFLLVLYSISNHFIASTPHVISRWFDLDAEANIPAWFSSSQLLVAFILALSYSLMTRDRVLSKFYLLLSFVLLFLSADETAMIHEGLTIISKKMSLYSPLPQGHGAWIFVYFPICLVAAFFFRQNVRAFLQEDAGRAAFLIGCVLFIGGSVGMEVIGYYIATTWTSSGIPYLIEVCFEEGLELGGESLVVYSMFVKIEFLQHRTRPEMSNCSATAVSQRHLAES